MVGIFIIPVLGILKIFTCPNFQFVATPLVTDDGRYVAHLVSSRSKTDWGGPEENDIQIVEEDQTVKRNISH